MKNIILIFSAVFILAISANAADSACVWNCNSKLQPPPRSDKEIRDRINQKLDADPLLKDAVVVVDTYKDLAILHGWALTRELRQEAAIVARGTRGVNGVYNYITYSRTPYEVLRHEVSVGRRTKYAKDWNYASPDPFIDYNGLWRRNSAMAYDQNVPYVEYNPTLLLLEVQDRLAVRPYVGAYKIYVDEYQGLIILHGIVPNKMAKNDAEDIASSVPGVKQVYSYIETRAQAVPVSGDTIPTIELHHTP